jgi:hypothetical protein
MKVVTDLGAVRDERKEICNFCGKDAHQGDYECPRIKGVWFGLETDSKGNQYVEQIEVRFHDEWEPDLAG